MLRRGKSLYAVLKAAEDPRSLLVVPTMQDYLRAVNVCKIFDRSIPAIFVYENKKTYAREEYKHGITKGPT